MSSEPTRSHQPGDAAPPEPDRAEAAPTATDHATRSGPGAFTPGAPRTTPEDPQLLVGTVPQSPEDAARASARSGGHEVSVPGYEVLVELGRGGMGVVYKARHARLNRVVALKMVLGTGGLPQGTVIRFLAEAEAVAAVRHPHVVQVSDYGEAAGRPFMALEYLPGGTLAGRLRSRGPAAEVAGWLEKVARGVGAAHDLGIVHRDLKPGNVLLDADGEPKLTDFGLVKRSTGSDLTATQAVLGTPPYMSPEQAKGDTKFVGPQADVWALGVILYEALTGTRPFDAGDVEGRSPASSPPTRPAPQARPLGPARPGADLPEVPGQAGPRAVPDGRGTRRRPGAVLARRTQSTTWHPLT